MSDVLSVAMYRAKLSRNAPNVVNMWSGNGLLERKLKAAKAQIINLQHENIELRGRIGGLTTRITEMAAASFSRPDSVPSSPRICDVADLVSREFRISIIDMQSERRTRDVIMPRQLAMYLSRKFTNRSFPAIARYFGGRDHTTVLHAVNKIENLLVTDADLRATVEKLRMELIP